MDYIDFYYNHWTTQTFLIVLATFSVAFVAKIFLTRWLRKAQHTSNRWDNCVINAALVPINLAIIVVGVTFAFKPYPAEDGSYLIELVPVIRELALIVLLSWFLFNLIKETEKTLVSDAGNRKPVDPTTASAISKLLRISVVVSAILIVMQYLGYSVSGVLAFGGIGGIAVGFAAKDLLSNFFGALMIHLDRPFKVGDWVRSPDKEIEGVVEDIGWRLTVIRTFDKRPLYVPNAVFTQIVVENPSRMTNRRIFETIGVRYADADKLPAILDEVRSMLKQHSELDQDLVQIVNFNKFATSSLDFFVYVLTKTTDWVTYHTVKQDVLFKILSIVAKHGAEVAFPTSSVHVETIGLPETKPSEK